MCLFVHLWLQIKDAPASAEEVHTVKETERNPSQNKENVLDPLEDYETYPCVRGIPPFPEDTWSSEGGNCVRTICATENINKTSDSLCVPLHWMELRRYALTPRPLIMSFPRNYREQDNGKLNT